MRKYPYLTPLNFIFFLLVGCTTKYAYYQSPFQANNTGYKTIPLQKDSNHSAIYAGGVASITGVNQHMRDGVYSFTGSIYRSHTSRHIQGYYGLTGTLGGYTVNDYGSQGSPDSRRGLFSVPYNYNLNDSLINTMKGDKFFGGWGAVAGINYCIPYRHSEWRLLGLEASWHHEFGEYLNFRNKLPDTAANINSRYQNNLILGINTEIVTYTRRGSRGYKVALIWFPHAYTFYNRLSEPKKVKSIYLSQTYQVTTKRITGYGQLNFGSYAAGFQLGMNYRLGR